MLKPTMRTKLIKMCFAVTTPTMLIIEAVLIILLYKYLPLIGFFSVVGIIVSCMVRFAITPEGQFFTPKHYDSPDDSHYARVPSQEKTKPMGRAVMNKGGEHEKIDDPFERKLINDRFNEITSDYE